MAKKIFCDVCGDEMTYNAVPPHLKGLDVPVRIKGHSGDLEFSVHVKVTPEGIGNGEHVDVCGNCRYFILDKLDIRSREDMENSRDDVLAEDKLAVAIGAALDALAKQEGLMRRKLESDDGLRLRVLHARAKRPS